MSLRIALLLAALALPLSAAPAAPRPPSIDAFFGLPNVMRARVSPDGTKIAFLFPVEDRMAIGVYDLAKKDAHMVVRGVDESIHSFFWKGSDHLVFEADIGGNESWFIGSTDLTGKHVVRIAESQEHQSLVGSAGSIVDSLPFDPTHIIASGEFVDDVGGMTRAAEWYSDAQLAKINILTKDRVILTRLRSGDAGFVVDNTGALRLRESYAKGVLSWTARGLGDKTFEPVTQYPRRGYKENWDFWDFAADNETVYVICRDEYDRGALYTYNTRTHTRSAPIFVPPEGEITDVLQSYDRTKLYGVEYDADKPHYHWFDANRGHVQQVLENTFPDMQVDIISTSADEKVSLVVVRSDRDPGTYYIFDQRAGHLTEFKRISNLDPQLMRPMQPITFKARDGLELHGYLTLPAGAEGKRVPLIIHPHGGPYGIRDSWGFDREVQFLASRGYAVLQVNYRGSGGYGVKFLEAGRYQWGRKMQDDLTDAVHWAIDQGIADPKHVAIYGASYGGYAALAGVTLTPDLYCCAVNYVGAADLTITFVPSNLSADEFNYQQAWVGKDRAYLEATSPVNLVDRIRVPTLHAYGEHDPRVKLKHWDRLKAELDKYHKPYESLDESDQGHGFRDVKASERFYAAMEQFLAKYLKP